MKQIETPIDIAVQKLLNDDIVAMPTETVYGLAGRIGSEVALNKIFSVKKRPFFDPLIVHVNSTEQARDCFFRWNEVADVLAATFWPGPLTLVMKKSNRISDVITSGIETVGVRWPAHPMAQELISKVAEPLAAPSANLFGRTSPTSANHVKEQFGNDVFVIDGGPCDFGIESTVLMIQESSDDLGLGSRFELSLLRKGSVTKSAISSALEKLSVQWSWNENPERRLAPGQMKHHYMPNRPLIIVKLEQVLMSPEELKSKILDQMATVPDQIEGVKIIKPSQVNTLFELKLPADPVQAARRLYSELRLAAESGRDIIIFVQTDEHQGELWESIFDRLYKAASLIVE